MYSLSTKLSDQYRKAIMLKKMPESRIKIRVESIEYNENLIGPPFPSRVAEAHQLIRGRCGRLMGLTGDEPAWL